MFDKLDPQVVFIVVAMVIAGLKWLVDRVRKTSQHGDEEPPGSGFEDLYEEARREIFERQDRESPEEEELRNRLGGRQEHATPPAIPSAPARPSFVPTPSPPPIPGSPGTRPARPALSKAEQDALKRLQARKSKTKASSRQTHSQSRVRALLSTPSSARDAIILGEILGPPKGAL